MGDDKTHNSGNAPPTEGTGKGVRFLAQPPPPEVPSEDWARAFLEAQSPDPEVRRRGRDALTAMGCQWQEVEVPPQPPQGPNEP